MSRYIGRRVRKLFGGVPYSGTVVSFVSPPEYDQYYYHVKYDDEDEEDYTLRDLKPILVLPESSLQKRFRGRYASMTDGESDEEDSDEEDEDEDKDEREEREEGNDDDSNGKSKDYSEGEEDEEESVYDSEEEDDDEEDEDFNDGDVKKRFPSSVKKKISQEKKLSLTQEIENSRGLRRTTRSQSMDNKIAEKGTNRPRTRSQRPTIDTGVVKGDRRPLPVEEARNCARQTPNQAGDLQITKPKSMLTQSRNRITLSDLRRLEVDKKIEQPQIGRRNFSQPQHYFQRTDMPSPSLTFHARGYKRCNSMNPLQNKRKRSTPTRVNVDSQQITTPNIDREDMSKYGARKNENLQIAKLDNDTSIMHRNIEKLFSKITPNVLQSMNMLFEMKNKDKPNICELKLQIQYPDMKLKGIEIKNDS